MLHTNISDLVSASNPCKHKFRTAVRETRRAGRSSLWPQHKLVSRPVLLSAQISITVISLSCTKAIGPTCASDVSTAAPRLAHRPSRTLPIRNANTTTTKDTTISTSTTAIGASSQSTTSGIIATKQHQPAAVGGLDAEPHLSTLRHTAGANAVHIADGPFGRGLFTTANVRAGDILLSVPDLSSLIVPDPENEPYQVSYNLEPTSIAADNLFYSASDHAIYLRQWQAYHALPLPVGLTALLADSAALPAPARLALWIMWLRRRCEETGTNTGRIVGAEEASVAREAAGEGAADGGCGGGEAAALVQERRQLLEASSSSLGKGLGGGIGTEERRSLGESRASGSSGKSSGSTTLAPTGGSSITDGSNAGGSGASGVSGGDGLGGRGLAFWRAYVASLPLPGEVTCLSAFNEEEAELLQVPCYEAQWRRTRDNLKWLLQLANEAAAADLLREQGETKGEHREEAEGLKAAIAAAALATARAGAGAEATPAFAGAGVVASEATAARHDSGSRSAAAVAAGGGNEHYSLDELCYCYAVATSRCFHLPGRMLFVPYADMANHQPLWQASAYPFWQRKRCNVYGDGYGNDDVTGTAVEAGRTCDRPHVQPASLTLSNGAGGGSGGPEADASVLGGWFQFRAVRDTAPGTEVCICYSEGGNSDQLFSYGFVRQANPYDRVDLNPHAPWPPTQGDDDSSWWQGDRLPAGPQLCWPAVVAAAGFWAPGEAQHPAPPPDQAQASDSSLDPAAEQSLLRPRGVAALRLALDPNPAGRMRLQRRRAALLSLPHTSADTALLRQRGLAWTASAEEELRSWLAQQGQGQGPQAQLETVRALQNLVQQMQAEMRTTSMYDEALWMALTAPEPQPWPAAVRLGASGGIAPALRGLLRAAAGGGGGGGLELRPSSAELSLYDSPRGRTALLARLEYKYVLEQAAEILVSYRGIVESVLCRG